MYKRTKIVTKHMFKVIKEGEERRIGKEKEKKPLQIKKL